MSLFTLPNPTEYIASRFAERFVVDGLLYRKAPISELPLEEAHQLIDSLYSPEERFAQGFYKYRVDILKHPEHLAWENTLEELEEYKAQLKGNLSDPNIYTVGYVKNDEYEPVGIYCMRDLMEHKRGPELVEALENLGLGQEYAGSKALVHSFSLLKDHRNLQMLKFIFIHIGIEALRHQYQHIFFFMSDHRLKSIYKRYGLTFPADLKFRSSQHAIGCYSLTDKNISTLIQAAELI